MAKLFAQRGGQPHLRHGRADPRRLRLHRASSPPSATCATCACTTIYEGTSEIQRIVIAREVLKAAVL